MACDGNLVPSTPAIYVYAVVRGPIPNRSFTGIKHFIVMIKIPLQYVHMRFRKSREEVHDHCLYSMELVKTNSEETVKRFHTDNNERFLALRKELKRKEIKVSTSSAYSPQSNRLPKIGNCTLLGKGQLLMKRTDINSRYSEQAILHAVYLYSRTVMAVLNMIKPHEMMFGPDHLNNGMKMFGCADYAHDNVSQRVNEVDDSAEK